MTLTDILTCALITAAGATAIIAAPLLVIAAFLAG